MAVGARLHVGIHRLTPRQRHIGPIAGCVEAGKLSTPGIDRRRASNNDVACKVIPDRLIVQQQNSGRYIDTGKNRCTLVAVVASRTNHINRIAAI